MTQDDLEAIAALDAAATPAPWHVRFLDDERCMSAVAISTQPDTGSHESMWTGGWPGEEIIAATLIQAPAYVIPSDNRWHENANLIAVVRSTLRNYCVWRDWVWWPSKSSDCERVAIALILCDDRLFL